MASLSSTDNVKLGVCRIYFDGIDLGYTKGGVEVEVATETYKVEVDQFGKTPINENIMGRTVNVKVPLAETTLPNMARIMPGAVLTSTGGVKATATVTFSVAAPVNNDAVTVNGVAFTFKTTPTGPNDMAVPASINAAATALAAAINDTDSGISSLVVATAALGVVTLTAAAVGTYANAYTLTKTGTNIAVSGATFASGADATKVKVVVPTGIGINLLSVAKKLVLRPLALDAIGDKSEDFTIPKAATAGALSFAYKLDEERIYNVSFMAYPDGQTSALFTVGNEEAA
jgi:hypothetical protein